MASTTGYRSHRRSSALRSGVAVALALLGSVLVSPPATATTTNRTVVSVFSDPGEYIGGGGSRLFYAGNGSVAVSGDATYLTVDVSGGTLGDSFSLTFAPPQGQRLRQQLYTGGQTAPWRATGRPGIMINGDGHGCSETAGRFDVKDIATTSDGRVTRLWLTFEQHCVQGPASIFGEVRYQEPEVQDAFFTSPQSLSFPDTYVGTMSTVVPVSVVARRGIASTTIEQVQLSGLDAADYSIRADECSGATLGSGELCQVFVRFQPSVAGPRVAILTVRDTSDAVKQIVLDGAGIGGTTALTMDSDPGDFIGQGQSWAYSPSNATLYFQGSRTFVYGYAYGNDGVYWSAQFQAPKGDILAEGVTYTGAMSYPVNGDAAGMNIAGQSRGCSELTGEFTVNDIRIGDDGVLLHVGIDFEQHCGGGTPALRGTFDYRVPTGDIVRPDPATDLAVARDGRIATVSWTDPGGDLAAAIVRYSRSHTPPASPNAQRFAYAGTGSSVRIRHLTGDRPLTVSVFTVDTAGNIGIAATYSV
jgi:hypothetical protein